VPHSPPHGRQGLVARPPSQDQIHILTRAIQQSPNAILIARADGVIDYINPSFTLLTGYTPEEIVGDRSPFSLTGGVSAQYRGLRGILREGREWRGEVRGKKKNGEQYWAHETITPICNLEGSITHYLVIRQDITQQKLDRLALQESEERFRQVAEMTGEWLWELDPEGRYLICSAAAKDILGFKPEEMLGRRYQEFLSQEELPGDGFRNLIEQNQGFCRVMNCYRHKEGHKVYTESTAEPLFDRKGCLLKWRGVDHNITARKRFEDELRQRNRAIEAASVGISIADATRPGYPLIYVNPALCKITGYTREEILGTGLRMLQGPETDPAAAVKIIKALLRKQECEITVKNYRKDGTTFWNELIISPVRDESGHPTHFISIYADVTERRRAEEQRHELDTARQIQLSLLPKSPLKLPYAQVFGVCVPAHHVGGDYFDYFPAGKDLDVVIADVSGHSMGSALIMAEARSTLKAEARRKKNGSEHGPSDTLRALNELLFEDLYGSDLFISMFYLRYSPNGGLLRYACAGHNRPFLLRNDAPTCEPLDADGMILGVEREVGFEEATLALSPGDRILLYTDGIVESRNETGEFFGTQRLCGLFACCRELPPQSVVETVLDALARFRGDAYEDDVTLVVIQIT